MARVLLVEDSVDIKRMVIALLGNDHTVDWAMDLKSAGELLNSHPDYDLLLLDLGLPDGSGAEFFANNAEKLEKQGTETILLTSTNTVMARINGFKMGAADFIAKPFDPLELQVRINAKLKRRQTTLNPTLRAGSVEVDLRKQQAFGIEGEARTALDLTPVEFKLLTLFLQNQGQIVDRAAILQNVWGPGVHVSTRVVDHHICGLRKKLSKTNERIESVYGVGYRLEAAAESANKDAA